VASPSCWSPFGFPALARRQISGCKRTGRRGRKRKRKRKKKKRNENASKNRAHLGVLYPALLLSHSYHGEPRGGTTGGGNREEKGRRECLSFPTLPSTAPRDGKGAKVA